MDSTLFFNLSLLLFIYSHSLLILSLPPNQMASPNGYHEDRANGGDLSIPPVATSFERRMLEYMAAQTQSLQAMAQAMVNMHQHITEQASFHSERTVMSSRGGGGGE
jgi:hypothetical protein